MSRIHFSDHLKAVLPAALMDVEAEQVSAVLDEVFAKCPRLRHYILDDRGHLRKGVRIYKDGTAITSLLDPVGPTSEIHIF